MSPHCNRHTVSPRSVIESLAHIASPTKLPPADRLKGFFRLAKLWNLRDDYLVGTRAVPKDPLAIYGRSKGGMIALLAIERFPITRQAVISSAR